MKPNLNNVNLKMSAGTIKQFPADRLPQVAFAGRSNVGKSSLINSLLQRKSLARVSGEPGKTITINFYDIDKKLYLVDLPGYGYAKRTRSEQAVWSKLTDVYFTNNPNIDSLKLVCQLIDSRTGPTQDDINMIYYLRETNTPYVIVATKSDKLNSAEKKEFMSSMAEDDMTSDSPLIMYSSKTGDGKAELWNQIYAHCSL